MYQGLWLDKPTDPQPVLSAITQLDVRVEMDATEHIMSCVAVVVVVIQVVSAELGNDLHFHGLCSRFAIRHFWGKGGGGAEHVLRARNDWSRPSWHNGAFSPLHESLTVLMGLRG